MNVPFFNYQARFSGVPSTVPQLIQEHCKSGEFILKSSVARFEHALETWLAHNATCLGVRSASGGMLLALKALGIGPGDEVITPAYSYISTASVIIAAGATPVFVDVSADDYMAPIEAICAAITSKTRAVIAVHLYSGLTDIPALRKKIPAGISIIEDSATALGGTMANIPAGLLGDVGVYSFFPAKPLGGLGDAGIIVTTNKKLHQVCKMLRNHGQDGKQRFTHHLLGFNSRMDDINAAFLLQKLPSLHAQNNRRREIATQYDNAFLSMNIHIQKNTHAGRVPYSYVLLTENPNRMIQHLHACGVEAKRGFPAAITRQPALQTWVKNPDDFAVADRIAREAVALPVYPELADTQIAQVIDVVSNFVQRKM